MGQWSEPVVSGMMFSLFNVGEEADVDEEVVDAPADVACAGVGALVPEGVVVWFGVEGSEGVGVAVADEGVDPLSFDGEEAGDFGVGAGSGEVDFLVGGVEVSADDDVAVGVAPVVDKVEEGVVEAHLVVEAFLVLFAVGEVDVEEGEAGVLGDEDAAFVVEFFYPDADVNGERFLFAEGGGAAVAFAFGWVPDVVIAGEVAQ